MKGRLVIKVQTPQTAPHAGVKYLKAIVLQKIKIRSTKTSPITISRGRGEIECEIATMSMDLDAPVPIQSVAYQPQQQNATYVAPPCIMMM